MRTHSSHQSGFGHIAVIFLVVFLAVAGFAGYKVVASHDSKSKVETASLPVASVAVPTKIKTKADLVQTSKVLDNSSTQVTSSLNDSSLNADLKDML